MKIIINALSGIGDAIMFSPSLSILKKHLPDSEIDMLVMFRQVKDIYNNNPDISNIYHINFLKQHWFRSLREVLSLRKHKYDVSINVYPSNRREYNIISLLEGAKKRIATRYKHQSFINFDFLNNILVNEIKNQHNAVENLNLVKQIISSKEEPGEYKLNINENDLNSAIKYIEDLDLKNNLLIGFHAGSATFKGHIMKRWEWKKYQELAKKLNIKYNARIILFGTETDVNEQIKDNLDFIHIPETKNINESIALMSRCRLFISNDTALMHIAAALKLPTVAIFAYTNYKELYPWENQHIIVRRELDCSPCFYNSPRPVECIRNTDEKFLCIRSISLEEVLEAAEKLLVKKIPGKSEPG